MIIRPLPLHGAAVVDVEPIHDSRGLFARLFCDRELAEYLGPRRICNVNYSHTRDRGALRGLHFQRPPHAEVKFVRCTRGAIFDVIVDIRRESPTFLQWHGTELTPDNKRLVVVPEGFAHGFQTQTTDCEVTYLVTEPWTPSHEGGLRHDDPALGIHWPLEITEISGKDSAHPWLLAGADPLETRP